ncbi:hypothetical protein HA402_013844 [Bradysia odoriphaga]|nr:hypothetical protein HA402_013844 [Bradysia odoriphaga]
MVPNFVLPVRVGVFFALIFQVYRVSTMECGTVNFVRPAILGGTETIKGEWPFTVAIQKDSKYICGGTIISNRHILTAAHCFHKKWSEAALSPHEVVVRLGAYNLTNSNEKGVVQGNVSDIIIHDDWEPFERRFDADIAILVLSESITFTDDIQPVCMPASGVPQNIEGIVVGYGVRINKTQAGIPRRIVVRAVNSSHCFRENGAVISFTSNRTFCGGNGDGSPDLGDSGSGYFYTPGLSWAQYGLVAAVQTNDTGHVFPYAFHIYTNLTMFKDWIIDTVNRTGGVVGEAKMNVILKCDYEYADPRNSTELIYSCKLNNIHIEGNNFETGSFVGPHLHGKKRRDVEEIHFVSGKMSHLPSGFGQFFKNIRFLTVGERMPNSVSLGTKVVRRSDLRNLRKLRKITFLRNDIETLDDDALWDLPNLEHFEFTENRLKVLSGKTFSKNRKLRFALLNSNQLHSLPADLFENNSALLIVDFRNNFLKAIDENIFRTNRRLHTVDLTSNRLETLPRHLFKNNLVLQAVSVVDNRLSSIDEDFFEKNGMLLGVDFGSNRIRSVPRKLFRNNSRLRSVIFRNNSIAAIDEDLFMKNERLYNVAFPFNKLERLHRNVFRKASLLNIFDMSANNLKIVDVDFTEFEQIRVIGLLVNNCIDAVYMKENLDSNAEDFVYTNLIDFQRVVAANCSNTMIRPYFF